MKAHTRRAIKDHAKGAFPREAAGYIVMVDGDEKYMPVTNLSDRNDSVVVCPRSQAKAYDAGEVVAFFHSHPNQPAMPSEADKVSCEAMGLPWYIYPLNDHNGDVVFGSLITLLPSGYRAPLIGRSFYHGVLDCYTLVMDYYEREMGITIPDFERDDQWWDKGQNLYMENFTKAGFAEVQSPQLGDVILMQYNSPMANHAGVYLGDTVLKSEQALFPIPDAMIHHASNRLSERVVYGGYWSDITRMILRHKDNL